MKDALQRGRGDHNRSAKLPEFSATEHFFTLNALVYNLLIFPALGIYFARPL